MLPTVTMASTMSRLVPTRILLACPKATSAIGSLEGASKARFERYMPAQSAREFVVLGGTKGDLQNDLLKGHVFLLSSEGPDAHDIDWRKDPRVIAATIG